MRQEGALKRERAIAYSLAQKVIFINYYSKLLLSCFCCVMTDRKLSSLLSALSNGGHLQTVSLTAHMGALSKLSSSMIATGEGVG